MLAAAAFALVYIGLAAYSDYTVYQSIQASVSRSGAWSEDGAAINVTNGGLLPVTIRISGNASGTWFNLSMDPQDLYLRAGQTGSLGVPIARLEQAVLDTGTGMDVLLNGGNVSLDMVIQADISPFLTASILDNQTVYLPALLSNLSVQFGTPFPYNSSYNAVPLTLYSDNKSPLSVDGTADVRLSNSSSGGDDLGRASRLSPSPAGVHNEAAVVVYFQTGPTRAGVLYAEAGT